MTAPRDPWEGRPWQGDLTLTPAEIAEHLAYLNQQMSQAQRDLKDATRRKVLLKMDWESARRAVELAEDTPAQDRGLWSASKRAAYIDQKVTGEEFAYRIAEATESAAAMRLKTLGEIANSVRSQNANVRGERGETWNSSAPRKPTGRGER